MLQAVANHIGLNRCKPGGNFSAYITSAGVVERLSVLAWWYGGSVFESRLEPALFFFIYLSFFIFHFHFIYISNSRIVIITKKKEVTAKIFVYISKCWKPVSDGLRWTLCQTYVYVVTLKTKWYGLMKNFMSFPHQNNLHFHKQETTDINSMQKSKNVNKKYIYDKFLFDAALINTFNT